MAALLAAETNLNKLIKIFSLEMEIKYRVETQTNQMLEVEVEEMLGKQEVKKVVKEKRRRRLKVERVAVKKVAKRRKPKPKI